MPKDKKIGTGDEDEAARASKVTRDNEQVALYDLRKQAEKLFEGKLSTLEAMSRLSHEDIARLVHELEVHQIELGMQNEELRRAQVHLDELRQKYMDLYDFAPVGYMTVNEDGLITEANHTCTALLGLERAGIVGKRFSTFVNPQDRDTYYLHRQRLIDSGIQQTCEIVLVRGGSTMFDSRLQSLPIYDPDRRYIGCRTIVSDITAEKKAEKTLRESEQRYRSLFDNMLEGFAYCRMMFGDGRPQDFVYLDVNDAFTRLTGLNNVIGKRVTDVIPGIKESNPGLFDTFGRVSLSGEPEKFETYVDSLGIWFSISVYSTEREHFVAVFDNVTGRKRAQEDLQSSERMMKSILSASPVGIALTKDREIQWVNDAWLRMFGFEDDCECVGQNARSLYSSGEEYERVGALLYERSATGEVTGKDAEFRRKDGSTFYGLIRTKALNPSDPAEGAISAISDITERKQAEDSRGASEQRLELVLWGADLGLYDWDVQSGKAFANQRSAEIVGYSLDEIEPSFDFWRGLLDPADSPRVLENVSNYLAGLTDYYEDEYRVRTKSGEWKWVLSRGKVVERDKDGRAVRMTGTYLDISERKYAEQALTENEARYRALFENMKNGVAIYAAVDNGEDFVIVDFNEAAEIVSGLSRNQVIGKRILDVFPGVKELGLFEMLRGTWLTGEPAHHPVNKYQDERIEIWVENFVYKLPSGDIVAVFSDETERKRMQEALKESEEWYRTLVEESFDGVFVQKGFKIIFASLRLHQMLGYSVGELEGLDHWLVYHPDYHKITSERATARMRGEEVVPHYEVRLQRKDGSSFEGEISARVVTVKGEPGVQVWVRDISKPKRSEEVQRRLGTAVEQAAEVIVITDTKGNVQYVNPAFERITGYTAEEVLGRNPRVLQSGEHDGMFYKNLWDTIERGDVWTGRFINRKKDGSLYHEEATISPVRDSSGTIVNFVAVKRDVTEHLALSTQLQQAQKMEAIGTLAGGIAHDFNNLLQVTLGFSELLLLEKEKDDPEYADLLKILQAAKNGAELVQRLLTFSRKVEPKPIPLNLNRRIVQVEKLLKRTIPKMIDIQMHLSDDLAEISADPIQMEQVLMNLAVNARDAMPNGGKFVLETKNVMLDDEYCKAHVGPSPGDYVSLTVSDTGHGMDKETVEHIFEPFYTTKELGRGTGLGLAMVYGIVSQHGGFIRCYSEVGRGTTFTVYFPAIQSLVGPGVETSEVMPAFGTETILLVDDEAFVRDLGERMLTKAGYTILTAANGIDALDLYRKEGKQIDLVILDLIMPKMGGEGCLKELLKIDPYVKILIASGYAADTAPGTPLELGARGFVSKPFRFKELLGQVRKVLDES